MGALLALIPAKDYAWGALVALLLAFGTYEHFHLIHEGEAIKAAADLKLRNTIAAKDKELADNAQLELIDVGNHEKLAIAAPAIPDAGLVCKSTRPSASGTAGASDAGKPADTGASVQSGGFDPSGAILTLLRDSDDQVNALIEANMILTRYINDLAASK